MWLRTDEKTTYPANECFEGLSGSHLPADEPEHLSPVHSTHSVARLLARIGGVGGMHGFLAALSRLRPGREPDDHAKVVDGALHRHDVHRQ